MTHNARSFTQLLSFKLGEYMAKGLYENYPTGFNELIPKMGEEIFNELLTTGISGDGVKNDK